MKDKTLSRSLAVLCALLMSAEVRAVPPEGGPKWDREAGMERILKKMDLSPEQKEKLKAHRKAHREEARKLREEARQKREELRQELENPDMSMERVKAVHSQLKGIQGRMADQRLNGILAVRQILTPAQFKRFHEIAREEWKKKDGKGRRKDHPGSPKKETPSR